MEGFCTWGTWTDTLGKSSDGRVEAGRETSEFSGQSETGRWSLKEGQQQGKRSKGDQDADVTDMLPGYLEMGVRERDGQKGINSKLSRLVNG